MVDLAVQTRVKSRMRALQIRTTDLARFVGCSRSALTKFMEGQTEETRYLPKIAEGLRTTVEYLSGSNADPGSGNWLGALSSSDKALITSLTHMVAADLKLFEALVRPFEIEAHQGATTYSEHRPSAARGEHEPSSRSSLAGRIALEMHRKGISQISLARKVGCSGAAMSNILSGKVQQTRLLPKIAEALQVPASDLYEDSRHAFGSVLTKQQISLVLRLRSLPPSSRGILLRTSAIFARSAERPA